MSRARWIILALVLQLTAAGVYLVVEASRDTSSSMLSTSAPSSASGQVVQFEVTSRDGTTRDLVGSSRPVLVHFWASWCPPCLDELPLVLALPDELGFEVVAVGLDKDWPQIEQFESARGNERVVRADRQLAQQVFAIASLPETVLMAPDGTLLLRVNGARDWSDASFRASWAQ